MVKTTKSAVAAMPNTFTTDVVLDFAGMDPVFNPANGQMVVRVPVFQCKNPPLNNVFYDDLKDAGLSDAEIDRAQDEFMAHINKSLFINSMFDRIVK